MKCWDRLLVVVFALMAVSCSNTEIFEVDNFELFAKRICSLVIEIGLLLDTVAFSYRMNELKPAVSPIVKVASVVSKYKVPEGLIIASSHAPFKTTVTDVVFFAVKVKFAECSPVVVGL